MRRKAQREGLVGFSVLTIAVCVVPVWHTHGIPQVSLPESKSLERLSKAKIVRTSMPISLTGTDPPWVLNTQARHEVDYIRLLEDHPWNLTK
jgi:hypothetical protein